MQVRPEMRADGAGLEALGDKPIMMDYGSIAGAQKHGIPIVVGSDGKPYEVKKILSVLPAPSILRQADVFLSYSSKDRPLIEALEKQIEDAGISVWLDRDLAGGQPFRNVLQKRIETVKAVVVLWTENSIGSKWVRAEADLADHHGKLICLRDPNLDPRRIPMPFAEAHMVEAGRLPELVEGLALKGAKPRV